jgi:hypothetical protein
VILALLALGCGRYGLENVIEDTSETADSDTEPPSLCADEPVCVTDVSPDHGPLAGGTTVTLTGHGFTGASVEFGRAALTTTVVSDETLTVVTPAAAVEAAIDITVTSDAGQWVAYDGYTYTDRVDTGQDTGKDTGIQPSGMIEGVVEYSYAAYGCPECFGLTSSLSFAVAAGFHSPVTGSWFSDLPPQGSCDSSSAFNPPAGAFVDVGDWVYLNAGSVSLPLRRTNGDSGVLYQGSFGESEKGWSSFYDLEIPGSGVVVQDVLHVTSGFSDVQPLAILNPQSTAFQATVRKQNASFTWAPTSIADEFIVHLQVFSPNGQSYLGEVICNSADNGGLTIPSGLLSSFPNNSLLAINMWRRQTNQTVNDATGHTIESASYIGLVGTATLK